MGPPRSALFPAFTRSRRRLRVGLPEPGKYLRGDRCGDLLLVLEGRVRPACYAREVAEPLGDLQPTTI
jgi:hypothetical protein